MTATVAAAQAAAREYLRRAPADVRIGLVTFASAVSVEVAPTRLVHRIDLAEVYLDRSNTAKAREQLEYIVRAPTLEANDVRYKRRAEELLARLR